MLQNALPVLPVPCTLEEALSAARDYMDTHKRVMEDFRTNMDHVFTRSKYVDFSKLRDDTLKAYQLVTSDKHMSKEHSRQYEPFSEMMKWETSMLKYPLYELMGRKDEELLQWNMQRMLLGQPAEVKMGVLAEVFHVTEPLGVITKPHVDLPSRHSKSLA